MKAVAAILACLVMAGPGICAYYVAGDFNGWNPAGELMTETTPGSGIWRVAITGLTPGRHEFKITNGTWSENWPWSGNSWLVVGSEGSITITYDTNLYNDGWFGAEKRIGVTTDPGSWTAVGDWQGWNNANPATAMTPLGGGIYYFEKADMPLGTHYYKAVNTGTWDAIGSDARSVNANSMSFAVTPGHERWGFWVNALEGTIKASSLPESPIYDGRNIPSDFEGTLLATQENPTSFGDTTGPETGSELDQLFVARGETAPGEGDGLFIGITGNLEINGNAYIILLDTTAGGSTSLLYTGDIGALAGLNGTALDPGFAPEYAVVLNTWGGTLYADLVDLSTNIKHYLGSNPVNSGTSTLSGGEGGYRTQASFNNTNGLGVTDDASRDPVQTTIDAATATTGLEMHIPFSDLGIAPLTSVKVMVILDGSSGWVSSQTLPGLGGGYGDLGQGGTRLDFSTIAGDQYAVVDLAAPISTPPVLDGASVPTDFSGYLVATQDNHTSFGDRGLQGSELDQLFASEDIGGLRIGLTGNLETNGNFWLIFIEAGPGGANVLPSVPPGVGPPSQPIQGLAGTTFDAGFAPTHVLCINTSGGTAWTDLVDLRTATSRSLGGAPVNSGSSDLAGDNPHGVLLAFDNTNTAGVTTSSSAEANSARTGAEIYLPFADINGAACAGEVKLLAILTSANGEVVSNQTLPATPGVPGNLKSETDPPVNFQSLAGTQFAVVPIGPGTFTPVESVEAARNLSNSGVVHLEDVRVAVSFGNGTFTVQNPGVPGALKVYWYPPSPPAGSQVDIDGYLSIASGQAIRSLNACRVNIDTGVPLVPVSAIGMGSLALGGGESGSNPGVDGMTTPNNIGTLVRIWGRVTDFITVPGCFYIDDGAGLWDGTTGELGPAIGVRVYADPFPDNLYQNAFVIVTGISTTWTEHPPEGPDVRHKQVDATEPPIVY